MITCEAFTPSDQNNRPVFLYSFTEPSAVEIASGDENKMARENDKEMAKATESRK